MNNGFVYFFKHRNIKGIKIGYTSKDSVLKRFESFKMYSPYGAIILGTIKTKHPAKLESQLHKEYQIFRLTGEFYDLSDEMVASILQKYNHDNETLLSMTNEWLLNENNDINDLHHFLKRGVLKSKTRFQYVDKINELKNLISEKFKESETNFLTANEINNILGGKIYHKFLGTVLLTSKFKRVSKFGRGYGYMMEPK